VAAAYRNLHRGQEKKIAPPGESPAEGPTETLDSFATAWNAAPAYAHAGAGISGGAIFRFGQRAGKTGHLKLVEGFYQSLTERRRE